MLPLPRPSAPAAQRARWGSSRARSSVRLRYADGAFAEAQRTPADARPRSIPRCTPITERCSARLFSAARAADARGRRAVALRRAAMRRSSTCWPARATTGRAPPGRGRRRACATATGTPRWCPGARCRCRPCSRRIATASSCARLRSPSEAAARASRPGVRAAHSRTCSTGLLPAHGLAGVAARRRARLPRARVSPIATGCTPRRRLARACGARHGIQPVLGAELSAGPVGQGRRRARRIDPARGCASRSRATARAMRSLCRLADRAPSRAGAARGDEMRARARSGLRLRRRSTPRRGSARSPRRGILARLRSASPSPRTVTDAPVARRRWRHVRACAPRQPRVVAAGRVTRLAGRPKATRRRRACSPALRRERAAAWSRPRERGRARRAGAPPRGGSELACRGAGRRPHALAAQRRLAAGDCTASPELGVPRFPHGARARRRDAVLHLHARCHEGLARRYPAGAARRGPVAWRASSSVIERLGFTRLLPARSRTSWASRARAGIPTVGRGSGASVDRRATCSASRTSIRCATGSRFERFLHPARRDCPDLDIDLCWMRRDEVIAHVYAHVRRRARGDDLDARDARRALRVPRGGAGARRAEPRASTRWRSVVPRELGGAAARDALARRPARRRGPGREPPLPRALRAAPSGSTGVAASPGDPPRRARDRRSPR